MTPYKSILCICKLKKNEEGTALTLDLPFHLYAQNIVCEGKSLTYRLNNLKNDGKEVLAKVDYCQVARLGITDDTELAEKFAGNLGQDWSKLKTDASYTKHYNVTKADALATYDEEGLKTPYIGIDKDEVTKFTQWEDLVAKAKEVKEAELIEITR